jgi:D-alanyl-D-alanine carboxypeptidase
MKNLSLLSILLISFFFSANAQPFDSTWASGFQTLLDKTVKAYGVKGASMAVYFPGQGVWTGVSGISSPGVPITPEMRFGIGSNSKLFLAIAILKLQEQGILSLDDQIHKWLPSIKYVDSSTTIRQLLQHQSGIFDFTNDNQSFFQDSVFKDTAHVWTTKEILKNIGPPHFAPGHGSSYSNTGYLIAGMIVEKATGKTWQKVLRETILDPLKMGNTFIALAEAPNGPVAHEWWNDTEIPSSPMTSEFSQVGACGSIFSTTEEMIQWYRIVLSDTILSAASMKQLMDYEPSAFFNISFLREYFARDLTYWFGGGLHGYRTTIRYDVKSKSLICIFVNGGGNIDYTWLDFFAVFNDLFFNQYPKKPNDAGISKINNPLEPTFSATVVPSVILENFGVNPLTSVKVNYQIDEGVVHTIQWTGLQNTGKTDTILLPEIITDEGRHLFSCYSSEPNGEAEGYNFNDSSKSNFIVNISATSNTTLDEDFEGDIFPPEGWTTNVLSKYYWCKCSLASYNGNFSAANANYYLNPNGLYNLETPVVDISSFSNPALSFQYAYEGSSDKLTVLISADCAQTWKTVFSHSGNGLRTVPSGKGDFYPQAKQDWKQQVIPLTGYNGKVIAMFQYKNTSGQNIYIDDVKIDESTAIETADAVTSGISIFPNPTLDIIQIKLPESSNSPSQLQLFDYTGRQILTLTLPTIQQGEPVTLNLGNRPAGIYLVRLRIGYVEYSGKVIKQ